MSDNNPWREYAEHLEGCVTCAEDGVNACHEGRPLQEAALSHPVTQAGALQAVTDEQIDALLPKNPFGLLTHFNVKQVREVVRAALALAATQPSAAPGDGQGALVDALNLYGDICFARGAGEWPDGEKREVPDHHDHARAFSAVLTLAAPSTATAAREQEQRERMNVRFANRPASAATADFDLPAASDAVAEREREATASKMEVDSWRRALLVWREAGLSEWIEDRAGLKQCLSNAARLLLDHPALASRPEAPAATSAEADPMDWPLPCDVTVGHGTMRKGVSLRTLVMRMKTLYEMATGNDADTVANRTPEERKELADKFLAAIHDKRPLHEKIAEVRKQERPSPEVLNMVVGSPIPSAEKLEPDNEEWRVGLYISSADPRKCVRVISEGAAEIKEHGAHRDFISWLYINPHTPIASNPQSPDAAALAGMQPVEGGEG